MSKTLQCKAEEAKVCCCVDVGTVIDNTDCVVDFEQVYSSEQDAKTALAYLTEKANDAANDPIQINSEINAVDGGYLLKAQFAFEYQAESMIFQLSTR